MKQQYNLIQIKESKPKKGIHKRYPVGDYHLTDREE